MRHEIGLENLLWGSDFPHPEGTWPETPTCLSHAFHDLPEDETARILGTNALDFYAFDRDAVHALATKIGPTPADVALPPPSRPSDYVGMGLR